MLRMLYAIWVNKINDIKFRSGLRLCFCARSVIWKSGGVSYSTDPVIDCCRSFLRNREQKGSGGAQLRQLIWELYPSGQKISGFCKRSVRAQLVLYNILNKISAYYWHNRIMLFTKMSYSTSIIFKCSKYEGCGVQGTGQWGQQSQSPLWLMNYFPEEVNHMTLWVTDIMGFIGYSTHRLEYRSLVFGDWRHFGSLFEVPLLSSDQMIYSIGPQEKSLEICSR